MRNKYAGHCADCDIIVAANQGYFERRNGRFVVRCMTCVTKGKLAKGKPLSDAQAAHMAQGGDK